MRLRWPSRCTFRTWGGGGAVRDLLGSQPHTGQPGGHSWLRTDRPGLEQNCTHVDKLQLPEVLHSVNGAVATDRKEWT